MVIEEDQFGNPETGDNTTVVTASLAAGVGPLWGATAVVSRGVATFAKLADAKAESLSLSFGSGALTPATSSGVVVGKATPTIAWPVPATMAYATPLGAAQLDATASVPGTFAYSPAAGTVLPAGPQPLSVTFTPDDPADYTAATASATIDVQVATATTLVVPAAMIAAHQAITLAAAVATLAGAATPTGTITFLDGAIVLGTAKLDATGHATLSTTSIPPGAGSITARYSGDTLSSPSTSAATPLRVRPAAPGDFDGDGKTDVAIYDQTAAVFYVSESGGKSIALPYGNPAHVNIPVAGDFDGDGKADFAIFDQTAAVFYVSESGGRSIALPYGNPAHVNIPVAGDFDGDGKADFAIFDQTAATFFLDESGGKSIAQPYGNPAHANLPIAGDFDGDGKADVAIYDPAAAILYVSKSGGGSITREFGSPGDGNLPLAGDFDGDGKADVAIYDPATAVFYVSESGGGSLVLPFGNKKHSNIPI